MSTWCKTLVAIVVGGVLGQWLGGYLLQYKFTTLIYSDHGRSVQHALGFSAIACTLLGGITGVAFVLRQKLRDAGWMCLGGGLFSLFFMMALGNTGYSHVRLQLILWMLFGGVQKHFSPWNTTKSSAHEFIADALIFHGVPLLWSCALLWIGCRLISSKRIQGVKKS